MKPSLKPAPTRSWFARCYHPCPPHETSCCKQDASPIKGAHDKDVCLIANTLPHVMIDRLPVDGPNSCLVCQCHHTYTVMSRNVCVCVGGQEPKVRPSAKYLQQHKFVVAPRPSLAAAALLPLIARSRDALQAMAAASDPPVAPPTSRSLCVYPPVQPCYFTVLQCTVSFCNYLDLLC